MRSRLLATVALGCVPATVHAGSLELVGSDSLQSRGMNSAIAVHGKFAYVGSRSDGPPPKGGIAVVDLGDPAAPRMVGSIGSPGEGAAGLSSRELRVWPQQDLLIVLRFACEAPQSCADHGAPPSLAFYDLRDDKARAPELIGTYAPSRLPHEFFLWVDPARPDKRALLYTSTPGAGIDNVLVLDISGAREGRIREVTSFATGLEDEDFSDGQPHVHSLSVSADGRRGYLAHLAAGFLAIDTSELAEDRPQPKIRLITPPAQRVAWGAPGAHSAIALPGRDVVLATDEVYGHTYGVAGALGVDVARGCPWGWVHMVDIADAAAPRLAGEYRVKPYNDQAYCTLEHAEESEKTTYSSHNPTATRDVAFITWHSAGLQVVDVSNPGSPQRLAEFRPAALPAVITEDPTFSTGPNKIVMWSYPVISDGLIVVADIRNGLYVLHYRGEHEGQVDCVAFAEGNSNLGAAADPCPLVMRSRRARVGRDRRLRIKLACTTRHASGCRGTLALRRGTRTLAARAFRVGRGDATLFLRLRRRVRRSTEASLEVSTVSGANNPETLAQVLQLLPARR